MHICKVIIKKYYKNYTYVLKAFYRDIMKRVYVAFSFLIPNFLDFDLFLLAFILHIIISHDNKIQIGTNCFI